MESNFRHSKVINSEESQRNVFIQQPEGLHNKLLVLNVFHSIIPFHIKFNHNPSFPPNFYLSYQTPWSAHRKAGGWGGGDTQHDDKGPKMLKACAVRPCKPATLTKQTSFPWLVPQSSSTERRSLKNQFIHSSFWPLCRNELGVNYTLLKTKNLIKTYKLQGRKLLWESEVP